MGYDGSGYGVGTRTRGKREHGETYRVRTGSGLTGVVSEQFLTVDQDQEGQEDIWPDELPSDPVISAWPDWSAAVLLMYLKC